MVLSYNNSQRILGWCVIPLLTLASLTGCIKLGDSKSENRQNDHSKTSESNQKLMSLHHFLDADDLKKFQPGTSKGELLKDIQWRGNFLMACKHKEKNTSVIAYQLFSQDPKGGGEVVWAIFIDDKFVKFVPWQQGDRAGRLRHIG